MTDGRDLSKDCDLTVAEAEESATEKRKAAEEQAFADKLAKRPPPTPVERAEIEKARKRTKARAPRIVMHVEDSRRLIGRPAQRTLRLSSSSSRVEFDVVILRGPGGSN